MHLSPLAGRGRIAKAIRVRGTIERARSWRRPTPDPSSPLRGGRGAERPVDAYCGSMPAAFATLRHFSSSFRMCAANSSGEVGVGSAPSCASFSFISAECSAFIDSAWICEMIAAGVPAGARKPYHCTAS